MNPSHKIQKLLIVDDHLPTRQWLRTCFSDLVGEICESSDGTEAVQVYTAQQPDWVLMDFEMKPINGLTATRLIRKSFPQARILMVTNHQNPGLRDAALSAGATCFLAKQDLWQVRQILERM